MHPEDKYYIEFSVLSEIPARTADRILKPLIEETVTQADFFFVSE
jgi:hypothetical protein